MSWAFIKSRGKRICMIIKILEPIQDILRYKLSLPKSTVKKKTFRKIENSHRLSECYSIEFRLNEYWIDLKLAGRIEFTNANIFHVLIIMSLGGNLNAISTGSL